MLLSPRVEIWPWDCQSLSPRHCFLQRAPSFLSARILVRKQMFCPSSNSETCPPYFEFSLSQQGKKPKTESKRQFSSLRSWHKTNCYFVLHFHFLKSLFWEIVLIFFYFSPPLLFHFQSALSLSLWQFCLAAIQQACPVSPCTSM